MRRVEKGLVTVQLDPTLLTEMVDIAHEDEHSLAAWLRLLARREVLARRRERERMDREER